MGKVFAATRMKQGAALLLVVCTVAACATMPVGGVSTPTGSATIPSSPLELGDWRRASAAATLSQFQGNVTGRYGVGLALGAVSSDLRRNEFACAANTETGGRGDPPDQICRKAVTVSSCTHTWQVHMFDEAGDGRLARTRGLYDRRCGGDGLLGGPS
jgi:hypothetical protein